MFDINFFKRIEVLILIQRGLQSVSGFIFLIIISLFVGINEQAWYYVFLSLAGFYSLFDLGLSTILVQFYSSKKKLTSTSQTRNLNFIQQRYFSLAICYFLFQMIFGSLYLYSINENYLFWFPAFIVLIIGYSSQLFILPRMAYLEGNGYIKEITLMRYFQIIAITTVTSSLLYANQTLWAASATSFLSFFIPFFWSKCFFNKMLFKNNFIVKFSFDSISRLPKKLSLNFKPLAISWFSTYISSQLYVLILMQFSHVVFAAQFGLSLTIANTIGILALSAHAGRISKLIDYSHDKKLLFTKFINDSVIYIFLFIFFGSASFLILAKSPLFIQSKILNLNSYFFILIFTFSLNYLQLFFSYSRVYLNEIFYKYNFIFSLFYLILSFIIIKINFILLPIFLGIFSFLLLVLYLKKFIYFFKI